MSCGRSVKWVCCRRLSCCGERDHSVFVLLSGQVEDPEQFFHMAGFGMELWAPSSHTGCGPSLLFRL